MLWLVGRATPNRLPCYRPRTIVDGKARAGVVWHKRVFNKSSNPMYRTPREQITAYVRCDIPDNVPLSSAASTEKSKYTKRPRLVIDDD